MEITTFASLAGHTLWRIATTQVKLSTLLYVVRESSETSLYAFIYIFGIILIPALLMLTMGLAKG